MKSPFTGGDVVLLKENQKAVFRKEEFDYTFLCYKCVDTDETFTTTQMDVINTAQIYNEYRTRHGIPFPDEINRIRTRYELSASKMSKILGFGDNQYRLYENGEIPSLANGRVLKAIQTPQTFETFVDAARDSLSEDEYNKIKKRLEGYKENAFEDVFLTNMIFGNTGRNKYNGYAMRSKAKLKNVILYFIEKFKNVYVTKMNKLLFYTDFLCYRECGQSMTGLTYKAIQYGPVPNEWDKVYALLDDISADDTPLGQILVSDISCDVSSFTNEQMEVLEKVYTTFKNNSAASMSSISHEELAWIDNFKSRSLIDFKYAFDLNAI